MVLLERQKGNAAREESELGIMNDFCKIAKPFNKKATTQKRGSEDERKAKGTWNHS